MSVYEEDSTSWNPVNKTFNVNDCIKFSKKLSVNNEQIAKLVKVKEHTKTWIKNVEKAHKVRNTLLDQPVVNYDVVFKDAFNHSTVMTTATPSVYPSVLPVKYSCSFCRTPAAAGVSQYHDTEAFPYVLLCETCSNKAR